jgi:hypothetical protein
MAIVLLLLASAVDAWTMVTITPSSSSSSLHQPPPLYTMSGWKKRRIHQRKILDYYSVLTAVSLENEHSSSRFEANDNAVVPDPTLSSIFPPPNPKVFQQLNNDDESIAGNNWVKPSLLSSAEIDLVEEFVVLSDNDAPLKEEESTVLQYDVGICGTLMQTGRLSLQIYQALLQSKLGGDEKDAILRPMTLEFTALQALQVVLQQSGLQVVSEIDTASNGTTTGSSASSTVSYLAGGVVESIRLIGAAPNDDDEEEDAPTWASFEAVLDSAWTPGLDFGLVVRNVPVQRTILSVPELLASIDPDGTLATQAAASSLPHGRAGEKINDTMDIMGSMDMDSIMDMDEPASLADLVAWNRFSVESAPHTVDSARTVYTGRIHATSYRPMHAQSLTQHGPTTTDDATLRHVMSALVSHGCLIVDVTSGGRDWARARILNDMWQSVSALYDHVDTAKIFGLPGLHTVTDAVGGGAHAKLGFASLQNGALQCLETRRSRTNGTVLPSQLSTVLGHDRSKALSEAFDVIVELCQSLVQIVVAASMVEAGAAASYDEANECAAKLVCEALDNGQSLTSNDMIVNEGSMSMSPHRLCRYTNTDQDTDEPNDQVLFGKAPSSSTAHSRSEIFGAHTDSTFVTAIPVAAVAGLEVFDEAANCWYRPELAAARHYQTVTTAGGENADVPWYARYVILMPGELLQLASRNEVLATVHRVVVNGQGGGGGTNVPSSRLSAPVLLRGRPGVILNTQRYLGGAGTCTLLQECDGQTMQSIDAALMYRSGSSQPP